MTNHFDSHGGEQNIAQGENAIGKQENVTQEVRHDGNIFSGTGNVTVNQGVRVKTRTVLLGAGLVVVMLGSGAVSWYWLAPPSQAPVINTMGGNVTVIYVVSDVPPEFFAQYKKLGKTTTNPTVNGFVFRNQWDNKLREIANKLDGSSSPSDVASQYAKELAVTETAMRSFFEILEKQEVPHDQLDSELRKIASQYKELLAQMDSVKSEDQQVLKIKEQAREAIEVSDYAKAEELLNQAEALDLKAIEQMEKTAKQLRISAAAVNADQARLQEIQLRYAKAAAYWQKAVALLPEESKKERSRYLHSAGYDLWRIAKYKEALPLFEQSLSISREIGDKAGEGTTLNNISQIYHDMGDHATALKYLEQSLSIRQELGDKAGEGATLNNISLIYSARGDYGTSLKYLEQSLSIRQELGDKAGEGTTLNNIGLIYSAWGDYAAALKYLEQSLSISREIGDKAGEGITLNNISLIYSARGDYGTSLMYLEQSLSISREIGDKEGEAVTIWNIGYAYEYRGNLSKAESYMSRAVQLAEELGHSKKDEYRQGLERVRAKLRGK